MAYEFKTQLLVRERERESEHDYLAYHSRRFAYVFNLCKCEVPDQMASVLDIGRSQLSSLLASYYRSVVTLGFLHGDWGHERVAHGREPDDHIEFDLNDAMRVDRIPDQRRFDLIVFAETIEHLHAAPELVLHLLGAMLKPGGLIVCQTPNAAAVHKRLKLLAGLHPYERIRIDERNPGHFREYTKAELVAMARVAGLVAVRHEFVEYFGRPQAGGALARAGFAAYRAASALAPSFRRGQTVILRADMS